MRNGLYKFMPLIFGAFLGWLIFHPPGFLAAMGPLKWLVNLALVGLLLLSVVPILALANLPENLRMEPIDEREVPAELQRMRQEFHRLGFRDAGPPLRVEVAPAAIVLGFVHPTEPVYGTAFRTTTVPAKTSNDFVSILDGERGGLTTNAHPEGAALPAAAGGFRQVLPNQPLELLFEAHLDGIRYLAGRGVGVRPVSSDAFRQDLAMALRKQRETFLSAPLRGSLLLFWRAATKQVPFVGRLSEQKIAAEQLQCLLSGRTEGAF